MVQEKLSPGWGDFSTITALAGVADEIWERFCDDPYIGPILKKDNRTGVIVNIIPELQHPSVRIVLTIDAPNPAKIPDYRYHAWEKIDRMLSLGHTTSGQSRDETEGNKKYAGAVLGKGVAVSVSGLWPDALDELYAAAFLVRISNLPVLKAQMILMDAHNQYATLLGGLCRKK